MGNSLPKNLEQLQTDKDSEYYIQHDYRVRPSQDPNRAREEGPEYNIDAESICYSDSLAGRPYVEPAVAVEWALDKLAQDNFNLAFVCRSCREWKPSRVIRPQRKGALQPEESCFGCWFGHLNGDRSRFTTLEQEAAFDWFTQVKDRIIKLELRRQKAKSRGAKHRLDHQRQELFEELKRAKAFCQKHGINPASQDQPDHDQPTDSSEMPSKPDPCCGNCMSWSFDEHLTGGKQVKRGHCWIQEDGRDTRESFWCPDYRRA